MTKLLNEISKENFKVQLNKIEKKSSFLVLKKLDAINYTAEFYHTKLKYLIKITF